MGQIATKTRADGQLTNLAGEFFVAAELLKRGLQTSVTFGNAKAIDLLAHNPAINHTFTVQVKALRAKNCFPISQDQVKAMHIYVFVLLNKPGEAVQYFIVLGALLVNEAGRFGKEFQDLKFPGILPKHLQDFAGAWHYFDRVPTIERVQ